MNEVVASSPSSIISHLIRNRLTSIALCADSLQHKLNKGLCVDPNRELNMIKFSVLDIKRVLDLMTANLAMERLALRQQQRECEPVGAALAPLGDSAFVALQHTIDNNSPAIKHK